MRKTLLAVIMALLLIGINVFAADGDLIVNGGKVGIGTTTPGYPLDIQKTGTQAGSSAFYPVAAIGGTGSTGGIYAGYNTRETYAGAIGSQTHSLSFWTYSGGWYENMTILANGNVGIGYVYPSYKLDVFGTVHASDFASSSDIRLKKNIEPINNALSLVQGLQGVKYDWDTEKMGYTVSDASGNTGFNANSGNSTLSGMDGKQIGLVAQDVEKVLPEVVMTDRDGYKAISYDKLTAVLIEAVKELKAEVEKLKGNK
jgi:trimeric autotransporter adhesin